MERTAQQAGTIVESSIPARLDALPWSRFHSLVIVALGITWVLDGLEVTLAGAVSGALKASPSLRLSDAQVGLSASAYLTGAVLGALLFGWLTDRFGRKRLFFVTLGVYILATAATALSQDFATFALFRFLTGAGIGGEYSAINSAIQELIPAQYRGRTDLAVNGHFDQSHLIVDSMNGRAGNGRPSPPIHPNATKCWVSRGETQPGGQSRTPGGGCGSAVCWLAGWLVGWWPVRGPGAGARGFGSMRNGLDAKRIEAVPQSTS